MRRLLLIAFVVLGSALVSSGQKHVSAIDPRVGTKADAKPTSPPAANLPTPLPAADQGQATDYVVGLGDLLSIIVLELQDEASFQDQKFRVDLSGSVSVPYVGHVRAAGLTTPEIEQELDAGLAKIVKI